MPFSDDDLEAFYRDVEARTAFRDQHRRARRGGVDYPPCPTPDKLPFASPADAREGIDRLRRHLIGTSPELRYYECSCGAWHITSSAQLIHRRVPPPAARRRKGKKKR
ncbi:hypothetical protein [Gordonia lacunae]|uniref:Uncharacterized protein n=1 Tax=Gordonia lacunae TaxID=417102 RepID=A0A2C9ZI94_9ACTN|nr:hypothetical protein [Gordonia lacunae]OUC76372.1 hypothetical protein CA982_22255 [Gordonia lacunae]